MAEGDAVAYAVAADQRAAGLSVVADAVNPLRRSPPGWRARTRKRVPPLEATWARPTAPR